MKIFPLICLLFVSTTVLAQVGINTTNPNAQLEIKSSDQANPANTDGILIPKVDAFPAINPTIDQDGMMVYLTTDVGANLKGFYYWDNTNSIWKGISGDKGWSLTGNAGTDANVNFIGTTDDRAVVFKMNNSMAGLLNNSNTAFGYGSLYNASLDTGLYGFGNGLGNAAFGSNSLGNNTTGGANNAFGQEALRLNTIGSFNNAIGYNALNSNTTGSNNVAIGHQALMGNTTGSANCAIGTEALLSNTAGYNNVANGYKALNSNTTGIENTAIGSGSLTFNTIGNDNTANGFNTLAKNTTGSYNVANGYQALYNNTTGVGNNAHGNRALYSNVIGNNNTAFGNAALYNNIADNNTAVGNEALYSNTIGAYNTANGYQALYSNTIGNFNTAFGNSSLYYNTGGAFNTSLGHGSLTYNTTGSYNCALGNKALNGNKMGYANIAIGAETLIISQGNKNVGVGTFGLMQNTTGDANVAIGNEALYRNVTGTGNGGYGENANPTTTNGWNNIGIGFHTLGQLNPSKVRIYGNEIGYDNIAFGLAAGDRIGNNCNQSAFIGPFTNVIANDTNVSNSTALGNGALVFQNNMMRLGNSAVTRIETQVGLTVVSDGRYKFNVKDEVKGLDFIKKLHPVVYQYDTEKMDREWMNVEFDTMVKHNPQLLNDYQKASQIRYSGFIAQEVEAASQALNYNFSGISKPEKSDGHYGLDYASFVVPLVKAMQEQQEMIETLKQQNKALENRLKAIEAKLNQTK